MNDSTCPHNGNGIIKDISIDQYQACVEQLHHTTWYVASTILMQSILTAILTEAFYNFGIRSWVQRLIIRQWMIGRNLTPVKEKMTAFQRSVGMGNGSNIYSLPYQQLCGQITNALRNQLDSGEGALLDIFARDVYPENLEKLKNKNAQDLSNEEQNDLAMIEEQVFNSADRGIDDLQITLAQWWLKVDYIFSIVISFVLSQGLLTVPTTWSVGNSTEERILVLAVSVISGSLAPTIRNFLLNILGKR
ncbi:hypothetical protein [Okeania sp. SIO1I7]|uniref:hypothetical protein n=1 Tax=Okeania sp. SIO1I7 TaxID=2607772 RepID=UPI0013F87985|nr:hypothetical protein [Okeania sp. SIO1I7]NET24774.1 hypothetical protein [Okeania sp. SIO1I7]